MPTRWGQTGWIHDDHKVQREFERMSREINEIKQEKSPIDKGDSNSTGGSTSDWALTIKHNGYVVPTAKIIQCINFVDKHDTTDTDDVIFETQPSFLESNLLSASFKGNGNSQQVNIKAKAKRKRLTGIVPINTLPDTSTTYHDRDAWKRVGSEWKPSNGYYGWYVYGVIDHGYRMLDPNDYILTLVDLHMEIIDGQYVLVPSSKAKVFHPEHEGVKIQVLEDGIEKEKDIIIIRGVYKPNQEEYYGGTVSIPDIEYIDENHIKTDIIFHYTLEVKSA